MNHLFTTVSSGHRCSLVAFPVAKWFVGEAPTQNHSSVFATDFLLIPLTSYADQGDLPGTAAAIGSNWGHPPSVHC